MRKLKVYGGLQFQSDGKQHRFVVATASKAKLAQTLGVGIYIVTTWWSETGNQQEIAKAMKTPNTLIDMGAI